MHFNTLQLGTGTEIYRI
ncbi:hypothetical protein E2C01_090151 [Portunus trituberculatus]|uniref:Uncharacterized protein n=1 Tax=Portunus trituberculatus TaxID=210409 RepID=A0A5B7JJH2_PORTR|nr:hypothetical protein [Portunus trituberculatus]